MPTTGTSVPSLLTAGIIQVVSVAIAGLVSMAMGYNVLQKVFFLIAALK